MSKIDSKRIRAYPTATLREDEELPVHHIPGQREETKGDRPWKEVAEVLGVHPQTCIDAHASAMKKLGPPLRAIAEEKGADPEEVIRIFTELLGDTQE